VEVTLLIVAVSVALLLVVAFDARRADSRRQQQLEQAMVGLITERGRNTLDEIGQIVAENKHVLGRYHGRSREFREAGSLAEATTWMRNGCQAIEELAPDFVSAVGALRRLARTTSVIVALPPFKAYAFRAWELRGVAGLCGVAHHVLVTGQERIRLRLRFLAYAFSMALRWLRRSTDRVVLHPEAQADWRRIDALVSDLATTGDETLVTARRIVQALDAIEIRQRGDQAAPAPGSVGSA
jgi:hypothetical protein